MKDFLLSSFMLLCVLFATNVIAKPARSNLSTLQRPLNELFADELRISIESPGLYHAELSNIGAAFVKYELLDSRYQTNDQRNLKSSNDAPIIEQRETDGPLNLVNGFTPTPLISLVDSSVELPTIQIWSLLADESNHSYRIIRFQLITQDLILQKTYKFSRNSYIIEMEFSIKNLRVSPISYHLVIALSAYQDPNLQSSMFQSISSEKSAMWNRSGRIRSYYLRDIVDKRVDVDDLRGDIRWLAINQRYFILAICLPRSEVIGDKQGMVRTDGNDQITISAAFSDWILHPGQTINRSFTIFAGPKLYSTLKEIRVDEKDSELEKSIEFWPRFAAVPFLYMLRTCYEWIQNWGLSLIAFSALISIILLPLYYANSLLMQLLILIPVGSIVLNTTELYRARFLWIKDLTSPDPYFILPILSAIIVSLQSHTGVGLFGIILTAISLFSPAAISLHLLIMTILYSMLVVKR